MQSGQHSISVLSASTFSQEGGIQRVTRGLLSCLRENWPSERISLLALHDRDAEAASPTLREDMKEGRLLYRPFRGGRLAYSRSALCHLLGQRPRLVLCEHAHLSVLPWLARPFTSFRWVSFAHYAELFSLSLLRRRALRRSDLIIAVSEATARATRRVLGPRCPPIVVCHLGLHPEYPNWARTAPPAPAGLVGRRNILIVGRMADRTRDKGHESLIRSMPSLAQQVPEVQLVIVGRGEDEPRLRRLTADLGMERYVHFAGFVSDRDLPAYYEACEIFAMPSFAEGFGLVYLEAMYHGKPCIAGNRDAAGEVVQDLETGLLVTPGQVEQVQSALARLLRNPGWAQQLGANGRARLETHFTYGHFTARLLKALEPFAPEVDRAQCPPDADSGVACAPSLNTRS